MTKIGYAQATFNRDIELTKQCIERVSPFVDVTIISYDQSLNLDDMKWFNDNKEKYNIDLVKYEWQDDMPAMRNSYLERAKELNIDWLAVSDPDELFSEELSKNLRILIEKYDKEDYNVIAVPVRDQFEGINNTDWFDDLDKLKEYPAGLRETNYWKPMLIYKIFIDIRYEGVGIEKKVHETLVTRYKQKTINLSLEYFYVHKKNIITIWRNAARNMFISGGGDNVGAKNRLWVELREICSDINIDNWNKFEHVINIGINKYLDETFIVKDKYKNDFNSWLKAALKALPTKEGTETRELTKWYLALHPNEVTPEFLNLIKTVPELTKEIELENFITKIYYQILGRHPDRYGLDRYATMILNKEIKRYELANILKNSQEYKEKFSNVIVSPSTLKTLDIKSSDYKMNLKNDDKLKYDRIQLYVNKMYTKILGCSVDISSSNYYTEAIMKRVIKPIDLPDIFRNSEEYRNKHVTKRTHDNDNISIKHTYNIPTKRELKLTNIGDEETHNTIALCIMGVSSELPFISQSIATMKDVVDEIHIQTDNFTKEDTEKLLNIDNKVKVHYEAWKDDFSDYKNKAYEHATTEWVLICDADEVPTKEISNNIKEIIKKSDKGMNYDMVSFDVINITTLDNKPISNNRNTNGKALLHWNIPSIYTGDLHIWIKNGYYPFKSIHDNSAYKHIKENDSILERSARNVVIGGGGDTSKEKNELWIELSNLRKELRLDTWKQVNDYLKKGNIDNRIIENFQKQSIKEWKDAELQDLKKYYLKLHPDESGRFING